MTTNTKATHTPGPWTVAPSRDLEGAYFIQEVGEDTPWEQEKANAIIIALAPEMFAALQSLSKAARLEEQNPDSFDEPLYSLVQRLANDILAKTRPA